MIPPSLCGDGDGTKSVPRLKLDSDKHQARVHSDVRTTPHPGVGRTAETPEERVVMEELRILRGFYQRRGFVLSIAKTHDVAILGSEDDNPTPQPGRVWRTAGTPQEKDVMEEKRKKLLYGFFKRRVFTAPKQGTEKME